MANYLPATGKILSRDSYWEDRLNPETNEFEKECVHTMRVEYTVNGRIYTHNFTGQDVRGDEGGDYALLYREDNPEIVKSAVTEKHDRMRRMGCLIPLIVIGVIVLLFFSLFNVTIG